MQPLELLERLKNLQGAANTLTITSAAVSKAIGEYAEFLGSDADFADLPVYAARLQRCIVAHADALEKYCKAASILAGGDGQ